MSSAFLQVVSGVRRGLNVPLRPGQNLVIGRKRGDLILDDPLVSGAHCRILPNDDGFLLQDLGSTNGTYHNGRRIQTGKLQSGDTIGCGKTIMRLQVSR